MDENLRVMCENTLDSVNTEISKDNNPSIKETGTVDQIVSNVLDFTVRVTENKEIAEKLLKNGLSPRRKDSSNFVNAIFIALVGFILRKYSINSKENPILSIVYTLNNLQHVQSKISKSNLIYIIPSEFLLSIQKDIQKYTSLYLAPFVSLSLRLFPCVHPQLLPLSHSSLSSSIPCFLSSSSLLMWRLDALNPSSLYSYILLLSFPLFHHYLLSKFKITLINFPVYLIGPKLMSQKVE